MTEYVTLKHVAEAAGVSVYSASRALNGLSGVSAETGQRVRDAAEALGYIPNPTARSLRRHDSRTIGVLTANSANEFYAQLVAGLESVVGTQGFHTLVSDSIENGVYSLERETAFIDSMVQLRVACVVLTFRVRPEQLKKLLERKIPVVFVDCTPPDGFEELPSVMSESEVVSRQVGEHFAEHGYRNWAFMGHTRGWPSREGRERGFKEAAQQAGARVHVIEGGNAIDVAHRAMAEFLTSPEGRGADAIYASNVPLLNGTVRAMRELGLRPGKDIGIINFDEFDWAVAADTPYTVVDQGIRHMGERAGALTLESLGHDAELPAPEIHQPILRIRESCGCPPDHQTTKAP